MSTDRLKAFSDGVVAILITVMVLELKVPQGTEWSALRPVVPLLMIYVLSYLYLGIYWNNHHHMLQLTDDINGRTLWANLHLLFWLSLIPWATNWVGLYYQSSLPSVIYGVILFMSGIAYLILQNVIIRHQGPDSKLAAAVGSDVKGKLSAVFYLMGIGVAFIHPWIANLVYFAVALMWIIPDPRVEQHILRSLSS